MTTTIKDPRIGMVIKGFEVIRKLGKGGMGAVYLAKHPVLGLAAIKFLDVPNCANSEDLVLRFEDEARALGTLRGTPNIASIIDISYDPLALITEYVEGCSFDFCLGEETLWSNAAELRYLYVLVQIAKALVKVHLEGLIHRDIKPENIMIKDLLAKVLYALLIDFGIAKKNPEEGEERRTTYRSVMGTLMYAPPEQLTDPLNIGKTVDFYPLGVMLFLIFSHGIHPYGSADHVRDQLKGKGEHDQIEWVRDLVKDEARTQELLEGIDPRAAKVIWSCLRYKPEDRVQSAEELHKDLLELFQGLSEEQKVKSVATTAAIPVLQEDPGSEGDTKKNTFPETMHWGTSPGTANSGDPEPKLEPVLKPKPRLRPELKLEPKPADKEEKENKKKLLVIAGVCVACAIGAAALGLAFVHYNAPPMKQVKEAKPPVMKRIVKKPPVMRPRPRPVKRVTPPPRRVVKRPKQRKKAVDPCIRKKWDIPSDKCLKSHCKRRTGTRPSDRCFLLHYVKAWIKCYKEDYNRSDFGKSPGRVVQCLSKYAEDLRGYVYNDFDRVALAALFVQEIRTNYCYTKRIRVCDKRRPYHYAKRSLLKSVCGSMHLRLNGKGKWCKRNYLCYLKTAKSDKIKVWLREKARVTRTKRIRTQWLLKTRKQFPRKTRCLDRA